MANSAGIPHIALLASPGRAPGAICLGFQGIDRVSLTSLLAGPDFLSLAQKVPCRVESLEFLALDRDLQNILTQAGCGPLVTSEVEYAPTAWPTGLAREKKWIAGDWYLAPPAKPTPNQLASRAQALRLVQLVAADADNHEIEAIFRQDPSLSYQLLRLVNSAGIGVGRQVASFAQAITILGRQHLRRWLNLLLFASRKDDPRGVMLLARVALRSRRMELIEKARGGDRAAQEHAFMAGMFSMLDVLFGLPLNEALKPLHLGDSMEAALCRHEGALGRQLQFALALESPDAMNAPTFIQSLAEQEVAANELGTIGFAACTWMFDVVRETSGTQDG